MPSSASRAAFAPDATSTSFTAPYTSAAARATMATLEEASTFTKPPIPPPAMETEAENLPMAVKAFPRAPVTVPTAPTTLPKTSTTGPTAAAKAAHFTMDSRWVLSSERNFCSSSPALSMICWIVGFRSSPICRANMSAVFFRLVRRDFVVAYRLLASVVRAVFFAHAALAVACVLLKSSDAFVARSRVSRRRISAMPISSRVLMALTPSSSILERPTINAWKAEAASRSHRSLNWDALIPETRAKSSSASPPVAAATSILMRALLKAEPPIWLSMPTEDRAAAKPKICASLKPTCLPAPARRRDMLMISDSVVA